MKGSKQCVSAVLSFLLAGCAETTLSPPVAPEATVLTKEHAKRVSGSNAYIRYYCNFGWGPSAFEDTKNGRTVRNSHKWVYAFNMKDPTTTADGLAAARHSVYQFWDITVNK